MADKKPVPKPKKEPQPGKFVDPLKEWEGEEKEDAAESRNRLRKAQDKITSSSDELARLMREVNKPGISHSERMLYLKWIAEAKSKKRDSEAEVKKTVAELASGQHLQQQAKLRAVALTEFLKQQDKKLGAAQKQSLKELQSKLDQMMSAKLTSKNHRQVSDLVDEIETLVQILPDKLQKTFAERDRRLDELLEHQEAARKLLLEQRQAMVDFTKRVGIGLFKNTIGRVGVGEFNINNLVRLGVGGYRAGKAAYSAVKQARDALIQRRDAKRVLAAVSRGQASVGQASPLIKQNAVVTDEAVPKNLVGSAQILQFPGQHRGGAANDDKTPSRSIKTYVAETHNFRIRLLRSIEDQTKKIKEGAADAGAGLLAGLSGLLESLSTKVLGGFKSVVKDLLIGSLPTLLRTVIGGLLSPLGVVVEGGAAASYLAAQQLKDNPQLREQYAKNDPTGMLSALSGDQGIASSIIDQAQGNASVFSRKTWSDSWDKLSNLWNGQESMSDNMKRIYAPESYARLQAQRKANAPVPLSKSQSKMAALSMEYFAKTGKQLNLGDQLPQAKSVSLPGASLGDVGSNNVSQADQVTELKRLGLLDKYGMDASVSGGKLSLRDRSDYPSAQPVATSTVPVANATTLPVDTTDKAPSAASTRPTSTVPPIQIKKASPQSDSQRNGASTIPMFDSSDGFFLAINSGLF
jgi:hypothetical protein